MIRPYAFAIFVSLFGALLLIIGISIIPTESSLNRYKRLIQQTKEENVEAATHKQNRQGVRKDLFVSHPDHRLQAMLTCPVSELTLTHGKGEAEVVENLKKFQCLMQEELYYIDSEGRKMPRGNIGKPMQIVRDFNALSGSFYYQRQMLIAERVFVSRYILPGHSLPELIKDAQPTMKGVARSSELNFGSGFKFKAENLKATFFTQSEIR